MVREDVLQFFREEAKRTLGKDPEEYIRESLPRLDEIDKKIIETKNEYDKIRRIDINKVAEPVIVEYEKIDRKDIATLDELGYTLYTIKEKIDRGDIIVDPKTMDALLNLIDLVSDSQSLLTKYYYDDPENNIYLSTLVYNFRKIGEEEVYSAVSRKTRKIDKLKAEINIPHDVLERLRMNINNISEALGRKCGFSIPHKDSVSPSELLNDVSNCVHIFAEYLNELSINEGDIVELEHKAPRIIVSKNYNKTLLEILAIWHTAVLRNYKEGLYHGPDYAVLKGYLIGDSLYLRVGSSTGHATNIYIDKNKLRVNYYDTDYDVNETIANMIEKDAPCSCKIHDDGVKCSCEIKPETVRNVPIALSLATSMDIRLEDETVREEMEEYEKLQEYIEKEYNKIEEKIDRWVKQLE